MKLYTFNHPLFLFGGTVSIHPSQVKKGSRNGSKPASEQLLCRICCSLLYSGTNVDELKLSLEGVLSWLHILACSTQVAERNINTTGALPGCYPSSLPVRCSVDVGMLYLLSYCSRSRSPVPSQSAIGMRCACKLRL